MSSDKYAIIKNNQLHPDTSTVDENQQQGAIEPVEDTSRPSTFRQRSEIPDQTALPVKFISSSQSEPDFNISRVIYVKGLEDDDLAGKLIAFFWWFTFLLARVLAISVFTFFFFEKTLWLLSAHFVIVIAFLIYDVKSDEVKRAKGIFFLFLGLIYIFCIIEFKIKFKKATFIYYGYFTLIFIENFTMCLIWYLGEVETIENDFWFRYVFYIVVIGSLTSLSSMIFYFIINKPPKVVVSLGVMKK